MGLEQARVVYQRFMGEAQDAEFSQAINLVLYFAVFTDSLCNDLCSHTMMFTVFDGSLRLAQEVVEDRAARAQEELRQHDVAMQAMQAGPTSLERSLEIMQREKHVRSLLIQGASAEAVNDAWKALRSLGNAEGNRINQLLYCVRLRAMIMPTRYEFLHNLADVISKP